MPKVGDRVGAILSAKEGVVRFLGFGTYMGKEVPPENVGGFNIGLPNPKILLDNGEVVWGCECWWGPEEKVKKEIEGQTIEQVSMCSFREEFDPGKGIARQIRISDDN